MLCDFLHVFIVEQAVEARLVYTHVHTKTYTNIRTTFQRPRTWHSSYMLCLLTVKTNVMVGEDRGAVTLGNPSHGNMQNTVSCFHIVLLDNNIATIIELNIVSGLIDRLCLDVADKRQRRYTLTDEGPWR